MPGWARRLWPASTLASAQWPSPLAIVFLNVLSCCFSCLCSGNEWEKRSAARRFFCASIRSSMTEGPRDISQLLVAWNNGDEEALRNLMSCVYPELRRIARQHLGHHPAGHTLESAALANEAYLKLIRAGGIRCENRTHFLALCSQIIRR